MNLQQRRDRGQCQCYLLATPFRLGLLISWNAIFVDGRCRLKTVRGIRARCTAFHWLWSFPRNQGMNGVKAVLWIHHRRAVRTFEIR